MPRSPFDRLVRDGVLTREGLAEAVQRSARQGISVGSVLRTEPGIPLETIGEALAAHYRVPFMACPGDFQRPPGLGDNLSREFWICHLAAPVAREKGRLVLLLADPSDLPLRDQLAASLKEPFDVRVGLREEILRLLTGSEPAAAPEPGEGGDGDPSALVGLVDQILIGSRRKKAVEIRFDPRVDPPDAQRIGELWEPLSLPPSLLQFLVRRLKVMANLDLGTRNKAQQGVLALRLPEGPVRFSVAVEPVGGGDEAARVTPIPG